MSGEEIEEGYILASCKVSTVHVCVYVCVWVGAFLSLSMCVHVCVCTLVCVWYVCVYQGVCGVLFGGGGSFCVRCSPNE